MITLDGIDITGLIMPDEFGFPNVVSVVDQSVINSPIVYSTEKYSGRNIDLVGGDSWGVLQKSVLDSLFALTGVINAVYTLVYESQTFSVRWRTEDQPAIEARKVQNRSNTQATDYFNNIVLKLMEVA